MSREDQFRDGKQSRAALDLSVVWPGPRVARTYFLRGARNEIEKLLRPYGEVTGFLPYELWNMLDRKTHSRLMKAVRGHHGKYNVLRPSFKTQHARALVMATREAHLAFRLALEAISDKLNPSRDTRYRLDEDGEEVKPATLPPVVKRLGPKERRIARRRTA